jgi:hypothetical protein
MGQCKGCGCEIDHYNWCQQCRNDRQLTLDDLARESTDIGLAALENSSRREANETALNMLEPLARDLAFEAGPQGVTVADLREAAEDKGVALPKTLASLGCVMRRAGLITTGRTRRSHIIESHGNLQVVWLHSKYAG